MKERLLKVRTYIIERAQEPSTWRGLTLMISAAGSSMDPDRMEVIMFVGVFIAGMIGALFPDKRE